jgi:hypothetical protein
VQNYPVRPSHRKNLEPAALAEIARSHFDSVAMDGETVTGGWGAIQRIAARANQRELAVELTMDPQVSVAIAAETIARYNRFLEETTGFGAKERARRLRKSVRAGPDEA